MGRQAEPTVGDEATKAQAVAALHNNVNYLRAIAALAGGSEVSTTRAVLSDQGQLLLPERTVLSPHFLEGWGHQRLGHALEDALALRDPVDIAALQALVQHLQSQHPLAKAMANAMGLERSVWSEVLSQTVWPARAAFQLSVMRAQFPQLYEHSVLSMMVAVYLACQQGWSVLQCARLAAAALLHDVGMLYLNPAWKDPDYRLSAQERVQLSAHPVLGRTVVAAMQAYPRSVEDAVLEHHERMDGGGYPRHLRAEAISPMGRILMLVEVVAGLYDKYPDMPAQRLSLMLRLNPSRYPAEHVAAVLALLQWDVREVPQAAAMTVDSVLAQSRQIALVRQYWASCKKVLPEHWHDMAGASAVDYVQRSMHTLQVSLAESGADMREPIDWPQLLAHDAQSVQELGLIMREALWQVERCTHTCMQRWPQLWIATAPDDARQSASAKLSVVERALVTWLHSVRKIVQSSADAVAETITVNASTAHDKATTADTQRMANTADTSAT